MAHRGTQNKPLLGGTNSLTHPRTKMITGSIQKEFEGKEGEGALTVAGVLISTVLLLALMFGLEGLHSEGTLVCTSYLVTAVGNLINPLKVSSPPLVVRRAAGNMRRLRAGSTELSALCTNAQRKRERENKKPLPLFHRLSLPRPSRPFSLCIRSVVLVSLLSA